NDDGYARAVVGDGRGSRPAGDPGRIRTAGRSLGPAQRRQGGAEAVGVVVDGDDDGEVGCGGGGRRAGMGQPGVEQAPGQAVGSFGGGDGFTGGQPSDEVPTGGRQAEDPEGRAADERRAVARPPGAAVEGHPEPGGKRNRLRSEGIDGRRRPVGATGCDPARPGDAGGGGGGVRVRGVRRGEGPAPNGASHHVAVMPASTGKTPPVTPLAASLHSQATRAATSSGSTRRRSGWWTAN